MKLKAPSPKLQATEKSQAPNLKPQRRGLWCLRFGASLKPGAWPLEPAPGRCGSSGFNDSKAKENIPGCSRPWRPPLSVLDVFAKEYKDCCERWEAIPGPLGRDDSKFHDFSTRLNFYQVENF
jgi:hypothetical protein